MARGDKKTQVTDLWYGDTGRETCATSLFHVRSQERDPIESRAFGDVDDSRDVAEFEAGFGLDKDDAWGHLRKALQARGQTVEFDALAIKENAAVASNGDDDA